MSYGIGVRQSLEKYSDHPIKYLWEKDIIEFPDEVNQFELVDLRTYKCRIIRKHETWHYQAILYLPEDHPCYETEEYPAEILYKKFAKEGILKDDFYTIDHDGKIKVKSSGTIMFLTNDIGDYTPYNDSKPFLKENPKYQNYWTFSQVRIYLEMLVECLTSYEERACKSLVKLVETLSNEITTVKLELFSTETPEERNSIFKKFICNMEETLNKSRQKSPRKKMSATSPEFLPA